jgi:cell fate (sporulation/competence/biofilm development) regulator YlbF (YheA/YmcA/DUF963 family)
MQATLEESIVTQKTRELCQTLIDQPEFQQIRQRIDAFMADESAKSQYQLVMEQGDNLQHKQQMGALDGGEVDSFYKNRDTLLANPVARNFIDAQDQMHKMQETVMRFVAKTFELGRVPNTEDLSEGGGCGTGCGCAH